MLLIDGYFILVERRPSVLLAAAQFDNLWLSYAAWFRDTLGRRLASRFSYRRRQKDTG